MLNNHRKRIMKFFLSFFQINIDEQRELIKQAIRDWWDVCRNKQITETVTLPQQLRHIDALL